MNSKHFLHNVLGIVSLCPKNAADYDWPVVCIFMRFEVALVPVLLYKPHICCIN